jgi:hypothetical protein
MLFYIKQNFLHISIFLENIIPTCSYSLCSVHKFVNCDVKQIIQLEIFELLFFYVCNIIVYYTFIYLRI